MVPPFHHELKAPADHLQRGVDVARRRAPRSRPGQLGARRTEVDVQIGPRLGPVDVVATEAGVHRAPARVGGPRLERNRVGVDVHEDAASGGHRACGEAARAAKGVDDLHAYPR